MNENALKPPFDEGPVQLVRVSDQIVRRLERAIRSGHYPIGVQLPSERQLMEGFGVGRPAVREALFTLRKMGLVEIRSGTRARVIEPTARIVIDELSSAAKHILAQPDGVRQFQNLRTLFEIGLVREAARNITAAGLRGLKNALDANRAAMNNDQAFIRTDIAFHFELADATGNPLIAALYEGMATWLQEQRTVAMLVPDVVPISYQGHKAIYDAIASGDAYAAEREMRQHLDLVAKNYWRGRGKD